jgi:hypothetical protein
VNLSLDVGPELERGFEAPLAQITPRAVDVGNDIDHDTLRQFASA